MAAPNGFRRLCILACLPVFAAAASEQRGQVTFNGLPVPGAVLTATQGGRTFSAITDPRGFYSFAGLADGIWRVKVEMFGFETEKREILAAPNAPAAKWELKLLPLARIKAAIQTPVAPAPVAAQPAGEKPPASTEAEEELSRRAADGFLINGSVNNGASFPFAQAAAFGNNRAGGKSLYNASIGFTLGNSNLDARPFSLSGQDTPKPAYNRITGSVAFGGPLRIPYLLKNGPFFFVGYQWTRNRNATTAPALMPDAAQRGGIFPAPILDPFTETPFPDNVIPESRFSPQAQALLRFYPRPNFEANKRYNYQIPIVSSTHQDALQSRFGKTLGSSNQLYGSFAFESTRTDTPNLFSFLDTTDILGVNSGVNWVHRLGQRLFLNLGVQFSRLSTRVTPFFENRENVSGNAGIAGTDQDPKNWGPPALVFASGIAGLSDSQSSSNHNQTSGVSYSMMWNRGVHTISLGADLRRPAFNYLSQQDARGTFTFTGTYTGSGFADFLLGIPGASSIAFGNADKYFRESVYDAYVTDDWRIRPGFTLNAGVRWEYGAPVTELYGRLVNLDVLPDFSAAAPVLAGDPRGALTGQRYPQSLVRPDKSGFEPRLGIAWRPLAGSSMIVRAGYGVYRDTSVYQILALQMAQQPPLSKTLSIQNSAANPFTLANGFLAPSNATGNTFAIDPDFRVGYSQNWQLSVQRALPASLQLKATYLGIKGTRAVQEFLPNTVPLGAQSPCPECPAGFAYLASNGNSSRHAAQIELRRRLRSGFTATLEYTFSKAIDDGAALGGQPASPNAQSPAGAQSARMEAPGSGRLAIAQDWRNLRAERSLSAFDQRHLLSLQAQYTTGMGLTGGTLIGGWKGALFKDWTFATQITAGSGLPQTPIYLAPVQGTGVTGSLRPDYTGAPLYEAPSGLSLNPAAYTEPLSGRWGNAGRNTITGPAQFSLSESLARTFRLGDRLNLDLRTDSANALNHVNFTSWNTTINGVQFGLPAAAGAMRSLQTTLRVRF